MPGGNRYMARVNIEERAAVGAKKLAWIMGWSRSDAIGKLYFLWHDSQELEQSLCSADDISIWMGLEGNEEQNIIPALIESGFLEDVGNSLYRICGNETHIDNLKQRREAAVLGGKKSAELRAGRSKPEPSASTDRLTEAQASGSTETQPSDEPSALLCSAIQYKEEEKEDRPPPRSSQSKFDFENIYKKYPRKEGKAKGLEKCRKQIKTQEDYDALSIAIDRYSAHCSSSGQYFKHFDSFMTTWRDWVDPTTGSTSVAVTKVPIEPARKAEYDQLEREMAEFNRACGIGK